MTQCRYTSKWILMCPKFSSETSASASKITLCRNREDHVCSLYLDKRWYTEHLLLYWKNISCRQNSKCFHIEHSSSIVAFLCCGRYLTTAADYRVTAQQLVYTPQYCSSPPNISDNGWDFISQLNCTLSLLWVTWNSLPIDNCLQPSFHTTVKWYYTYET